MKPFATIEEAKAELRDMPTEGLQVLQDMTQDHFDRGAITEVQYDFVMTLIVDEALDRVQRLIAEALGVDVDAMFTAPEGETVH